MKITTEKTWKQIMIDTVRRHWWYEAGSLEAMSEAEVKEVYERLLDWIEE